jgi:hypothetical protein
MRIMALVLASALAVWFMNPASAATAAIFRVSGMMPLLLRLSR